MIKLIQTGRGVHNVIDVMDKFILKFYTSAELARREELGINTFYFNSPGSAPKIVFRLGRLTIFDKLKSNDQINKPLICDQLSDIITKLNKTQLSGNTEWINYLQANKSQFQSNIRVLRQKLGSDRTGKITQIVDYINRVDWDNFPSQPLHRDLHIGNLIITDSGVKIIDFEHFQFGPLEYEFCNSLLFADGFSLDFDLIVQKLAQNGVFINSNLTKLLTIVYFVEQFILSCKSQDEAKQNLLMAKLDHFLISNNIFSQIDSAGKCLAN